MYLFIEKLAPFHVIFLYAIHNFNHILAFVQFTK